MYILDSNIISYSIYHPHDYPLLMRNIRAVKPAERWISIVTAQELIAYKYEEIHKTKNMPQSRLLKFYHQFDRILRLISRLQVKPFDSDAYAKFLGMPGHLVSSIVASLPQRYRMALPLFLTTGILGKSKSPDRDCDLKIGLTKTTPSEQWFWPVSKLG